MYLSSELVLHEPVTAAPCVASDAAVVPAAIPSVSPCVLASRSSTSLFLASVLARLLPSSQSLVMCTLKRSLYVRRSLFSGSGRPVGILKMRLHRCTAPCSIQYGVDLYLASPGTLGCSLGCTGSTQSHSQSCTWKGSRPNSHVPGGYAECRAL